MPGVARGLIDIHFNPSDCCGCDSCCHVVTGYAVAWSPDTYANGHGVLRAGIDDGVHSGCCGPNIWRTQDGSPNVFVNGYPVVRNGDTNWCCGGGDPHMITGSPDVIIN